MLRNEYGKLLHFKLYLTPQLSVTPVEFYPDLLRRKTTVSGAVMRLCLCYPLFSHFSTISACDVLTDIQTNTQTDRHNSMAYTATALRRAVKSEN